MTYLTEKSILEIISIYVTRFAVTYPNVSPWSYFLNSKFKCTFWWWGKEARLDRIGGRSCIPNYWNSVICLAFLGTCLHWEMWSSLKHKIVWRLILIHKMQGKVTFCGSTPLDQAFTWDWLINIAMQLAVLWNEQLLVVSSLPFAPWNEEGSQAPY